MHNFQRSRSKNGDRKNLVSISLTVKNIEAVIQTFAEFTKASETVVQNCLQNLQKTPEVESLFNIVTGIRCFLINFEKCFKNVCL